MWKHRQTLRNDLPKRAMLDAVTKHGAVMDLRPSGVSLVALGNPMQLVAGLNRADVLRATGNDGGVAVHAKIGEGIVCSQEKYSFGVGFDRLWPMADVNRVPGGLRQKQSALGR